MKKLCAILITFLMIFANTAIYAADFSSQNNNKSISEAITFTNKSSVNTVAYNDKINESKAKIVKSEKIQTAKDSTVLGTKTTATTLATASDIVVFDLKPAANQPSTFKALADTYLQVTVANIGGSTSASCTLGVVLDNTLLVSTTVGSMAPNTGFIFTITLSGINEGLHNVKIVGDYNNNIAESNENNNSVSGTYNWVGTPNLTADSIAASVGSPYIAGQTVTFTFKVTNNGSGSIPGDCPVQLLVNGSVMGTWTVTNWTKQNTLTGTIDITFHIPGTYTVQIKADPNNTVNESNENDNTISSTYQVN